MGPKRDRLVKACEDVESSSWWERPERTLMSITGVPSFAGQDLSSLEQLKVQWTLHASSKHTHEPLSELLLAVRVLGNGWVPRVQLLLQGR